MVISHNLAAMNAQRQYNIVSGRKSKSAEKLSSGYRVNRSADDAAGLAISEKLRRQIRGLRQGRDNTLDGISWVQIGDGAMNELNDIVNRITELSVKGANGTLSPDDRSYIDTEIRALKKEINHISKTTTFNDIPIFDNTYVQMDVSGTPDDLEIFDAAYDDITGEVSFGGVIFHGERISWDTINQDMVTTDTNGKQIFKAGEYSYTTANGQTFHFTCKDGAEVPDFTRTISISANSSGITIDGETIAFSHLLDDDGNNASAQNVNSDVWTLNYHGAELSFFVPYEVDTLDELAAAINSCNNGKVTYTWQSSYEGSTPEQAVSAGMVDKIQISSELADKIKDSDKYSLIVRADNDGIWLENSDGTSLTDSKRTWAEMGITSWDSGNDITDEVKYKYYSDSNPADALVSFEFNLSDVTSVDSVIDGLDGMVLNNYGFITSYNTVVTPSVDNNVEACSAKIVNKIDFSDEIALGRDFDQQKISNVWTGNISVTANAAGNGDEAHIDITNAGNTVRAFSGSIETAEEQMTDDIDSFLNYIAKQKTAALLAGQDPDNYQMQSLADLVGTDNITTSGYFDGTVTINSNMTLSDGTIGYTPGYVGRTYPTAYIDFKNITDLSSLDELGFNSTCKTCNNHYSIVFKNSLNSSYTTSEGYGYNFSSQGQNYTLEIDLDSLSRNGVNDGAGIANAIVSIASDAFDFHYTQYAAEGSKLYVFDDRASTAVATYATFDTDPYTAVYEGVYDVNLSSDDGNYINLNYNYNFRDSQSQVKVAMVEDADGSYVKNADGSYSLYTPPADPTTATNVVRYNIQTSFTDTNGNLTSRSDAAASYAKAAVNKMLTNTSVSLNALDYTYTKMRGNEKSNVAIRAEYDSKMVMSPYVNGITIKHSSGMDDFTFISRFPMNTLTMGLSKAGCKTIEQAEKTLDYVKTASRYVSEKRSLYGAYQNRLEHTYNNNYNIEENTTAAESRIRDTDMAAEMVQLSKENILEQVGQAIMSQANQSNQGVLELLR